MSKPKIYLAGAISGLTYDDAEAWRINVAKALSPDIECFSPLRNKQYLRVEGVLEQSYPHNVFSSDKGINTRDHWDCMTSDLIFVNLLGASRVSIGTVMEIAWAHAYRKPCVVVMEQSGNVHEHPMIREAIGFRVQTIEEGIVAARAILLP